jgi:hypothetical protein
MSQGNQSFWTDPKAPEPKRGYRWLMEMGNTRIPAYVLKKVSKPSFTVSETAHKFLNHTYWYPGRVEWNTVSMTLADPVNPDAAGLVMEAIQESGYSPLTHEPAKPKTMSKSKAREALGDIKIIQINSEGDEIEKWTLINAWIKDVKTGELDYESDDLVNLELEIRYDYAHLWTANGSPQDIFDPGKVFKAED